MVRGGKNMNINTAQNRPQILNRPKPPVPLFNGSLAKGKETNSNASKKQKVGQEVPIPSSQEHSLTQQPLSTFISGFFEQSASPASSVSDSSREKSSKSVNETPLPPFDFSFRDHSSICTDKLGPSSFSLVTKQESRKRNRGEVDLGEVDLLCTESLVADSSGFGFSFSSSQYYSQPSSPRIAVDSSDLTVARIIFDEKLDRLDQPTIQTRRNREGDIIEKSIHNTQTILALKAAFNSFKKSIKKNN